MSDRQYQIVIKLFELTDIYKINVSLFRLSVTATLTTVLIKKRVEGNLLFLFEFP